MSTSMVKQSRALSTSLTIGCFLIVLGFLALPSVALGEQTDNLVSSEPKTGWNSDKSRWYDDGVMAQNHCFYDPDSDNWYWADTDGSIATDKDVFIPKDESEVDENGIWTGEGKWTRYDADRRMVKGWDTRYGGKYYFDPITGEMTKGEVYMGSNVLTVSSLAGWYHFDEITGKMDIDKDVYVRSNGGKWVRYDEDGRMVHGEDYRKSKDDGKMHWWFFDSVTGAMQKGMLDIRDGSKTKTVYYDLTMGWMLYGDQVINGQKLHFNEVTGALEQSTSNKSEVTEYSSETVKKIIETAVSYESANTNNQYWYGTVVTVQPNNTQLKLTCDGFTAYIHYLCGVQAWETYSMGANRWDDSSYYAQIRWIDSLGNLKKSIDQLEPGDIVFYGKSYTNLRHAAIYKGNGIIVHAADKAHGIREGPVSDLGDFYAGGSPLKK